jgi:hypothetical protein
VQAGMPDVPQPGAPAETDAELPWDPLRGEGR